MAELSKWQQWIVNVATPIAESAARAAIGEVKDELVAEVKQELGELKTDVLGRIDELPAQLLGAAAKPVEDLLHEITGTTSDIAGAVQGKVSPLFDVLNTDSLAQKIIGQMMPGGQKPPWWPFG